MWKNRGKLNSDELLRILTIVSTTLTVTYGIYLLVVITQPLYVVVGVIEGYVALSHYDLKYYGRQLLIDSLHNVSTLTIPLYCLSIYLLTSGLLTVYRYVRHRDLTLSVRLMFGGGLSTATLSGYLAGLIYRVVMVELPRLEVSLNTVSSAGRVYLGSSAVQAVQPMNLLTSTITITLLTVVYIIVSGLTYI
ncbi:MAG: hypothetical protein QXP80_01510, partial [Zestosphaera sp.]